MVTIIELGKNDGNRITRLSDRLMDGAESLNNEIRGPTNWRGRGVINLLRIMQSSILSLDERLDGNWVSIFIKLGPKRNKQMLVNTETCNVSVCIMFNLYDVSIELTIFDDILSVRNAGHCEYEGACNEMLPFRSRRVGDAN